MRPGIPPLMYGRLLHAGPFNEAQAMRPGILEFDRGVRPPTVLPSMRPRPCGPGYVQYLLK